MDLKVLFVVFGTVFLAELGDKTQLATVLFASKPSVSLATVFIGASLSAAGVAAPALLFHPLAGAEKLFIAPKTAIAGAIAGYLSLWSVYHLFRIVTGMLSQVPLWVQIDG